MCNSSGRRERCSRNLTGRSRKRRYITTTGSCQPPQALARSLGTETIRAWAPQPAGSARLNMVIVGDVLVAGAASIVAREYHGARVGHDRSAKASEPVKKSSLG